MLKPHRWLFAVACDWLIIISIFALAIYTGSIWFYLLALLIIGNRQHALSILAHDGAHRLAFTNKKINDWATEILTMWPIVITLTPYRKFHFAHHRYTGEIGLDPELGRPFKGGGKRYLLPKTKRQIFFQVLKDLLGDGTNEIIGYIRYAKPEKMRDRIGPIAWWLIVGSTLIFFGFWQFIILWFLALFTSFWACFRLRIFTEHVGTNGTHKVHLNWWWRQICAPHNTWYHYEHHQFPQVPFYELPKLRSGETISLGELFSSYTI